MNSAVQVAIHAINNVKSLPMVRLQSSAPEIHQNNANCVILFFLRVGRSINFERLYLLFCTSSDEVQSRYGKKIIANNFLFVCCEK